MPLKILKKFREPLPRWLSRNSKPTKPFRLEGHFYLKNAWLHNLSSIPARVIIEVPHFRSGSFSADAARRNLIVDFLDAHDRWIRRFKENPMFREGIDWIGISPLLTEGQNLSSPRGGQNIEDYRLTTWVCEHLGQMQDSPRGHQIREYFSVRYRLAANQLNDSCCKQS